MRLVNEIILKVFTLYSDLFEGTGMRKRERESSDDKDNLQQVAFDVLCHKLLGKSLSSTRRDEKKVKRDRKRVTVKARWLRGGENSMALPLAHAKCHKNKLPTNMTNSNNSSNSSVNFAKTTRNFRDSQLQHLKRVESAAHTHTQ